MIIVFVSNFFTPHQEPLARAFNNISDVSFYFVETMPMSLERRNMGWNYSSLPDFVIRGYSEDVDKNSVEQLIYDADIVMWGGVSISWIKRRLQSDRLTFCYSERVFKRGINLYEYIGRFIKYTLRLWKYQKNHYLLSASAYCYSDYRKLFLFKGKAFKWGYFPYYKKYDLDRLMNSKTYNTRTSILWVGRLIGWKHPDVAIRVAEKLKNRGSIFDINIIGDGPLKDLLSKEIREKCLVEYVHIIGNVSMETVREYMEQSDIFLFTSDQNEGWGVVLNEAFNSGCAVVASNLIGSVPYLIRNARNGFIYKNERELVEYTERLVDNKELRTLIGKQAYTTISQMWNPDVAAQRLLSLAESIKQENEIDFSDGPCSRES